LARWRGGPEAAHARQGARNLLEVPWNSPARRWGYAPLPDRGDHLLEALLGDPIEEQVVHRHHGSLVARRQALLFFQREQAVFGDTLGPRSQELLGALVQSSPADEGARGVGADRDGVPTARGELQDGIEGRD